MTKARMVMAAPPAVRYITFAAPMRSKATRRHVRSIISWWAPMSALRSAQWYSSGDRDAYLHRAWMRRGLPDDAFHDRPHIAIANTASDLTPCNSHLDEIAASVKQGVAEAGGVALNLPMVSLG